MQKNVLVFRKHFNHIQWHRLCYEKVTGTHLIILIFGISSSCIIGVEANKEKKEPQKHQKIYVPLLMSMFY